MPSSSAVCSAVPSGSQPSCRVLNAHGAHITRFWVQTRPSRAGRVNEFFGLVTHADYREMLLAIAGAARALTGLLFVALSVAPRREPTQGPGIIRQVRAGAALLAFTKAVAVSLFGLVPQTNVGYPSVTLGVIGLFFTAASIRSVASSGATAGQLRAQLGLIGLLLLIFGTELIAGIAAVADPAGSNPPEIIGYALVASVLVGIGRAWELVGDIDTGLTASLTVLTGHRLAAGDAEREPEEHDSWPVPSQLAQQQLADPAARHTQAENSHDGQVQRMPEQAGADEAEGEAT